MSAVMEEETKRETARRKSALVLEIIQGKPLCRSRVASSTCCHHRSRAGSMAASAGGRARCVPNRQMCATVRAAAQESVGGVW